MEKPKVILAMRLRFIIDFESEQTAYDYSYYSYYFILPRFHRHIIFEVGNAMIDAIEIFFKIKICQLFFSL